MNESANVECINLSEKIPVLDLWGKHDHNKAAYKNDIFLQGSVIGILVKQ